MIEPVQIFGLISENRRQQISRRRSAERLLTGEHLVQHNSETPDVSARIHCQATRLLRRHIRDRAEYHSRLA